MAWDLEGLIAGLVVFISCAGEQGYPVAELVYAIRQSLRASLDGPQVPDPGTEGTGDEHVASLRATATVWAWLVQRPDVFVGPDRKYNHLALEEVLGLSRPAGSEHIEDVPESSSEDRIAAPSNEPRTSQPHTGGHGPRGDIRVTVSEDTMWESITGHGVDYKRLPLSEWQCLLGIASTMRRGIVQGDLRRLVGQDKRSVPKRTDALAKKGYIIKRTTLVTGAKTSKMWLAQFAPILIRDDGDVDRQVTAGMDLSPSFLTANLDPVPWHTRWTGESIDYSALATTIVATSKAWGTIRMSDMKSKLGVLRLRWQMRVLSKTCRFLSARGVIQYVAAALEHKIYKDCIRYVRDMDSRDWTMYLIAGKRRLGEIPDGEDGLATENAGPSSLTTLVQWSPDEHLPQYITRTARISGTVGFSNPDLYFLTLGSSFSRFISSLTSTMATSTVQPPHLEQLQLRSELDRSGKVAFFRYFLHPGVDSEDSPAAVQDPDSSSSLYGFPPTSAEAGQMDGTLSLSRVCSKLAPPRGRPPKLQPQRGVTTEASPQHVDEDQPATPPQPKVAARQGGPPKQRSQRVATPEPSLNQDEDHRTSPPQPEVKRTRGRPRKQQPETAVTLEAGPQQDEEDHQPPPPQLEVKRKRGRPRKQQPETATTLEAGPQQDEEDHQPPPPQLEVKRKRGRPRKQQPPRASTPETGPQSAEEKHPDTPHQLEVALKVTPRSLRAVLRSSAANIGLVDLNMIRDISHIGPVHKSDSSKPNGVATEDLNAVEGNPLDETSADKSAINVADTTLDIGRNTGTIREHRRKSPSVRGRANSMGRGDGYGHDPRPDRNHSPDRDPSASPGRGGGRGRGRGRGPGRGRGRGRGQARGRGGAGVTGGVSPDSKPYKCETCGGSWKNDLGLKYHLEKSKTPCNPSYDPAVVTVRSSARSKLTAALISSNGVEHGSAEDREDASDAEQCRQPSESESEESVTSGGISRLDRQRYRRKADTKKTRPSGDWSQKVSTPRRLQTIKAQDSNALPPRQAEQGVLLLDQGMRMNKVSDLLPHGSHTPLVSSPIYPDIGPETTTRLKVDESENMDFDTRVHLSSNVNVRTQAGLEQQQLDPALVPELVEPSSQTQKTSDQPPIRTVSRTERNNRVGALMGLILDKNNGIFPGGEALWRTLRMAWDRHYPSETSPTTRGFHSSLKWLTGMNKLADHWHAFRGRNGVFSKCQIVTWPHIDAFSPEALDVMDKIKEAHPKLYIPENVESADGLNLRVDGEFVNSRRPLPEIVSVLDAPVYAAQRAAKRELEEAEDEGRERKRRQKTTRSTRGTKGQVRWISDIRGETLDPRSTASLVGADKDPSIQFLEPNTHLDEEEPSGFSLNELSQGRRPSAANKAARTTPRNSREPDVGSSPSSGIIAPSYIWDIGVGAWPNHDIRFFDEVNSSVTLQGWFPSSKWHAWAAIVEEIDKRAGAKASRGWFRTHEDSPYQRFLNRLRACIEVEMSWVEAFVHASRGVAGPHNTFIQFFCRPTEDLREMGDISWPSDGQLTPDNMSRGTDVFDIAESSGDDDENGILGPLLSKNERGRGTGRRGRRPRRIYDIRKRVPLVRRRLTALPKRDGRRTEESSEAAAAQQAESVRDPGEVLSAIIVVRTLLGGIERAIDWGLLAHVFPDMTLGSLRKVWFEAQKSQGAHIAKFTRDFSERFIAACKNDEVPMIDFDHPLDYDWDSLIKWAMEIPGQEDVEIPSTLEGLGERYTLHDAKSVDEDWRERYFHAQASTYSRLDLVTAIPGATAADGLENPALPSNADVARSWMRSLCCTGETAHTPKDVKEGLLRLVVDDEQKVASLLKTAIEQLTRHKIIHKSLRPGLGGRPYRLTEWYLSTVAKLSQWAKYQEAAAVKAQLDTLYRNGESFKVPYTINDGAMMALMNMSAYGRIRLLSQDVPYIPFGFEPGNYESRKYPKSYYHFNLAAVPTETYQFNEDIPCLQAVAGEPPPSRGPRHAIPQWIDFFGHCDMNMWCKVLGAVCFAYSTRGQMGIDVLCSALRPTLEPFEAQMILDWGRKTGVLEASPLGKGVTVGEWWWLAVPWQQQQQAT